ncbi:hypothetical protein N7466_004527 [Penicillium verhagenii]|uniref:uncharacterized protein n=1 Tax=Penicillium verhagenii TaxID=1562060 RepID=UPI002545480D|nr:uncharacterized protein N7466_004527 [Penicillium verhagenii]KAJ5934980.1 hypothetical protein N7466_004527 [Penicillium verhagenii]
MDKLPVEILTKVIDLLTPSEKVQVQSVSKKFFDLARDNNLWKLHCYEQSSAALQSSRPAGRISESLLAHPTATLSSLGQSSLRDLIQPPPPALEEGAQSDSRGLSVGDRARAASDWESSIEGEHVDWYSEYIARHGPMSLSWVQQPMMQNGEGRKRTPYEVKGMGLLKDWSSARQNKIVAPLDDGSVCIWDLNHAHCGGSQSSKGKIIGMSEPGLLMKNLSRRRDPSPSKSSLEFINLGEGVSVDSFRHRAYLAVGNVLNEIDLETLKLISQQRYPWSIFALSQETDYSVPLTLATTLSLQIHDARLPATEEEEAISLRCEENSAPLVPELDIFPYSDSPRLELQPNGLPPHRIRSPGPSDNTNYAPLFQPGPLSILHPPAPHVNSIILAGRFPSILCYDRRFFPRLQSTVHSGGSLCGLASAPEPRFPVFKDSDYPASHSVVACGEYKGKGSLELYNLSSSSEEPQSRPSDRSSALAPQYTNRQSAASSKLLSVASHGNRIVYSDSEGNIKWVERNGRAEVRRWNINSSQPQIPFFRSSRAHSPGQPGTEDLQPRGLWPSSQPDNNSSEVARKILPTGGNLTGDELLVWTGERIGRIKFSIPADPDLEDDEDEWFMHAEVDEETRDAMRHKLRDDWEKEQRYENTMRRALERQADEVRWMGTDSLG